MRSEYTKHSFGVAVEQFFEWSGEKLPHVTLDLLEAYVLHLADRTAAPKLGQRRITWGTFNKYTMALKLFLRYCVKKGWLELSVDDLEDVLKKWPGGVARPYLILEEAEIKAIMNAARTQRDKAMLALGLFAGLRNFEICTLKADDIGKDDQGAYVVVRGKGNKEATIPIAQDLYELLGIYKAYPGGDGRIWNISTEAMRAMVKRTARHAGITKTITPHSLRHTYAYRLFKKEVPVLIISKMLRHSNLAVTTGYLAHLSREDTARYAPEMPA